MPAKAGTTNGLRASLTASAKGNSGQRNSWLTTKDELKRELQRKPAHKKREKFDDDSLFVG